MPRPKSPSKSRPKSAASPGVRESTGTDEDALLERAVSAGLSPKSGFRKGTSPSLELDKSVSGSKTQKKKEGKKGHPMLYKHVLPYEGDYCWVLAFPNEEHEKYKYDDERKAKLKDEREDTILRLLRCGCAIKTHVSHDEDVFLVLTGAPQGLLELVATRIRIPVKFRRQITVGDTTEIVETYRPFDLFHKNDYVGLNQPGEEFRFRPKSRLKLVEAIMRDPWNPSLSRFGAGLHPEGMISDGTLLALFPMHDEGLEKFKQSWARFGLMCNFREGAWHIPSADIRDYFGEEIAMYFNFLSFYTHSLIKPMIFGALSGTVYEVFHNIEDGKWDIVADIAVVAYSVWIVIWSTVFLQNWKMREAELAHGWGTLEMEMKEVQLPSFKGTYDPILDRLVHDDKLHPNSSCKKIMSALVVLISVLIVACTMGFYIFFEALLGRTLGLDYESLGAVLMAVTIMVFNAIYNDIARKLNEMENYETEQEFNNQLTLKRFMFQFVNSYFLLYLTVFVKPWGTVAHDGGTFKSPNGTLATFEETGDWNWVASAFGTCMCGKYEPASCTSDYTCLNYGCTNIPAPLCDCTEFSCQFYGGVLLTELFFIQIFVGNTLEVLLPYLALRSQKKKQAKLAEEGRHISKYEAQFQMTTYGDDGVFDDYNEMVLQFGYVTFFAADFPFVTVFAFLNNLIEVRSDSYKLVESMQRPVPKFVSSIGCWHSILDVMSFIAVTTNFASIFFVSGLMKDVAWTTRILCLFAAEHVAFGFKVIYNYSIPDVPHDIAMDIERNDAMKDRIVLMELLERVDRETSGEGNDIRQYRDPDVPPTYDFVYLPFEVDASASMNGLQGLEIEQQAESHAAADETTPMTGKPKKKAKGKAKGKYGASSK